MLILPRRHRQRHGLLVLVATIFAIIYTYFNPPARLVLLKRPSAHVEFKNEESFESKFGQFPASDPKVAVVFYGLIRGLRLTYGSIQQNILQKLDRHSVQYVIFLHRVVFVQNYTNVRSGEYISHFDNDEYRLLNPDVEKHTGHEEFLEQERELLDTVLRYGDEQTNGGLHTLNTIEALRSLKLAVTEAKHHHHNFDGMIILRPDLIYQDAIDVNLLRWAISHHSIVLPGWQMWGGLNDRFAFGAWEPMYAFGSRYDYMVEYCENTSKPLHPETFLKWHLEHTNGNATSCHTNQRATRVRENGDIRQENFALDKSFRPCPV